MSTIEYYANGKLHRLAARAPAQLKAPKPALGAHLKDGAAPRATTAVHAVQAQSVRLAPLFHSVAAEAMLIAVPAAGGPAVIPTATLIVEGANKTELKRLREKFGLTVLNEGKEGKVLLRAPDGGAAGIQQAADAAKAAYESGKVKAASPNFLRVVNRIGPSAAAGQRLWNHQNDGNPGVPGADVAARAAWTLTRGVADVRVAVLDEGVDTTHPALQAAVVAEKDFVDGNPTARPDGNDAHGTACAGIIVSRDATTPGLASGCSLVAARIAKGDGAGGWVFDDFQTADAIDWAWDDAKADVLSNSWGGGPPVDVITRAFERARTKGRGGRGAVVAIATGNSNTALQFPSTLPNVLAVGASNGWDERKSPTSRDGEPWGSCYGKGLSLVAPGVRIATTDIQGAAGYGSSDFVDGFNGTSSATPHVAAAAALILSLAKDLGEDAVRNAITASADRLTPTGKWDKFVGWGRLNLFTALRLARRL
ncbi:S8 family serine peptidase [Gemmata sp. JC717]|uniref:S8 family serine peptidase n=1 Tax=Gemmata algarum TaxID=2975278 RepID=UPI0021BB6116|nr:S8 family serine peptidase [Gemmata algarum]MDY3554777.1 S8 family serine peptidase [Gemmata algarum]